MRARESRPQGLGSLEAAGDSAAANLKSTSSLRGPLAYAVLFETSEGRESRKLYLSLHSASRAVDRAEKRGHVAKLVLCALVPVGGECP